MLNRSYAAPSSTNGIPIALSYEDRIMDYIAGHGSITRMEAQTLLGIGQTMVGRIIRRMEENGLVQTVGKGRTTRYIRHQERT